jgi:Zn-dependent protease/CBS domain-containing protein
VLRMGWISGIPVYVARSWLLVAALIAFLLGPRIDVVAPGLGALVYVAGLAFAVLLYLSVLLHEVSHALMAQAFGMRVVSVTLHFLGGVTEIESEAETPGREFWISVVGPLTSAAVGLAALVGAGAAPEGLVQFALQSLAVANLVVAVLNLLPGLPLDGGKVLRSVVWAATGRPSLATLVAGWGGRVVAVTALGYPLLLEVFLDVEPTVIDFLIAAIVAGFLWTGASQSLRVARLREKLPRLHARAMARRALTVPGELPLSEAVRRAHEAGAGSLVVVGPDGRPGGIVVEQAVSATPKDRRPWVSTSTVARGLRPGTMLPADLSGEALVRAINAAPASEYLLVEPDGSVHGVLVTADVDRAISRI